MARAKPLPGSIEYHLLKAFTVQRGNDNLKMALTAQCSEQVVANFQRKDMSTSRLLQTVKTKTYPYEGLLQPVYTHVLTTVNLHAQKGGHWCMKAYFSLCIHMP